MIHPTAVVHSGAEVDPSCEVGAYSVIGDRVSLGPSTVVDPHVVIEGPTRIGAHNRIHAFASVGGAPQDLKFDGEETWLEIGDHNTIREYATINRGTGQGGGYTRLGDHNLFMAYTHVAHDCQVGNHVVFSNGASLAGHVVVEDHATLAGFSLVHQFCRVGCHSFAGMGSAINCDVAPYTLVSGNFAKARGINTVGLRRKGFARETLSGLKRAYASLIRRHGDRQEALQDIDELVQAHPEVAHFAQFVASSTRGVVRHNARETPSDN
ncbi:MAG: acyl-ACP--UDP-N-acetylglucosamine O-acyltransferase [Pseudomonadota bacterium]